MDFITNLNLLALFVIIGGIGFVFLLVSLVIGDIFEAVGFDFNLGGLDFDILDSRVVSVFITAFGGFGAIGVQSGFGALVSSLIGLLGGVVFGGVVSLFARFLTSQQASSSVSDDSLIGRTAQVTVGIQPGQIGQIAARIGDERVERVARSKNGEEIKTGSIVIIEAIAGDSVIVINKPDPSYLTD